MISIISAHLTTVPDGLVLAAIFAWAMFENRGKYLGLLGK